MTIDDADTQTRLSFGGGEPLVQTEHPDLQSGSAASASWGWAYWNDLSLPAALPGPTTPVFTGLIWSWVKSFEDGFTFPSAQANPSGTNSEQWRRQTIFHTIVSE